MKRNKKCKDGHVLNWNECGYGGGPTADVYCDRCKRDVGVPVKVYKQKQPYLYFLWLIENNMDKNSDISK